MRTVESAVPWKMKTLSPRRLDVASIILVAANELACAISALTLTVFGNDMHIVAAMRPVDAQLYGTAIIFLNKLFLNNKRRVYERPAIIPTPKTSVE